MLNNVILILSGIIGAFLVMFIRNKIIAKTKDLVIEKWDTAKFIDGITNVVDPKKWGQTLSWWLNFRNWIIVGIIISVIFGYGVYRGKLGKPISINIGYGKEAQIKLDGSYLHIYKDGSVWVEDDKGNKVKQICVKDIPALAKKLSPFGVQIVPIFVGGVGINKEKTQGEIGGGISWLKYFQWRIDNFLTNRGVYLGISYRLNKLENSAVGIAMGKTYKDASNRIMIYWRWKF